jgi:hypothetical protein
LSVSFCVVGSGGVLLVVWAVSWDESVYAAISLQIKTQQPTQASCNQTAPAPTYLAAQEL